MMIKTVFLSSCCFALIACGGGSSGGGSTSSGGSSGSSNTTFPASFTKSVQENSDGSLLQESFLFNAPSDVLPSNVSITGPDAVLFIVFIEASATPAANGDRTITVTVQRNPDTALFAGFNFEDPEDANLDNIYEFSVSAFFQGQTIASDFTLTITDDPTDAAELTGGGFFTALTGAVSQASIPDITGDGLAELVVTFAADTAYVVGSESLSSVSAITDITQDGNHILSFDLDIDSPNRAPSVSGIENADGDIELLISSAEARKSVLYRIPQSQRDGSFTQGAIDISSISENIGILDMPDSFSSNLGEWIEDISGDGRPDIFFGGDGSNGTELGAFLFETASLFNTDSVAQFDIEISHNISTTLGEIQGVTVTDDLDGDNIPDVFIYGPSFTSFVSGSHLRALATTNLDLSNLSNDEGLTYEDGVGDVVLYTDHNDDGFPTLILPPREGSSFSSEAIDASTFLEGPVNGSASIPARRITAAAVLGNTIRGPVTVLDDMNGDDVPELHFFNFPSDGVIISGAIIGQALDEISNSNFLIPVIDSMELVQLGVKEQSGIGGASPIIIGDLFLLTEAGCFGGLETCSGSSAWSLIDITDSFANGASGIILR